MADKYSTIQQHQPLRVPSGWQKQERALIVQLDEIFDDIYRRFGRLRIEDMSKEFRQRLEDEEGNVAELEITANRLSSSIGNWQSQSTIAQTINSLDSRISSLGYGTVYMQADEPNHSELVPGDIWFQTQASSTWSEVNTDYSSWEDIYDNIKTWQTLGGVPIMWVWDGRKWQEEMNALDSDTFETEIAQNAYNISLLATQVGNKYTIQSGINITANGIDISGAQYVKIASGGYLQVQTGNFGIDTNSSTYVLWSGASDAANSTFWIKKDGTIKAISGTIGGWTLAANKLSSGSSTGYVGLDSNTSNSYAIWAGNETASSAPFRLNRNGSLHAVSGDIGGWSLASNKLSSGSSTGYVALDSNTSNTYALWCGGETAASAPFRLKRDGSLAVTKLLAIGSDGTTETTVNLRTAGLWKLSYRTVTNLTATTNGDITTLTLGTSNGDLSVNFSNAAAGWKAAANAVSYVSGSQSVTVPSQTEYGTTTTLSVTATWIAGYNSANEQYTSAGSRQWGYYSNGSWHGYGLTGMTLYQKNS